MASLHYLTIQDVLWINFQVTKRVQQFNYARLEEAVFYQYAYGESNTLFPQAARFVSGFVKMHPFDDGNEATAFLACLAFLEINGYEVTTDESKMSDWFQRATGKESTGATAIAEIASPRDAHVSLAPDVRAAVQALLEKCGSIVASLYDPTVKQSA